MKKLLTLLLIIAVGVAAYNWWQVQQLRQEVARLQLQVQEQQQANAKTDAVVAEATRMLAKAREALTHMDSATAQRYAENARDTLQRAQRTAGEKAGPALKWLQAQASDLSRRVEEHVNSRH